MKLHLSPLTLIYFALCLLFSHDMTLVAICSAVLIHELTHLTVLWLAGGSAALLTVTPMGLSIERIGLLSHRGEILLSLLAPVANLLLAALYAYLNLDPCAVEANLGFGLLNLLPIYPLDGGKALSSILSVRLERESTERIVSWVSMLFLLFFWLLAVAVALVLNGGLSMLILSVGLFLSVTDVGGSNK
ncbi:MAG: site-2 protease family protein [Clostridia bacterium]|nr:site-2 protease family protein [Clostridia bacterium]